jgi:hypothetical protein
MEDEYTRDTHACYDLENACDDMHGQFSFLGRQVLLASL